MLLRCNTRDPQKLVNDLLSCLCTDEYLATHSLTGSKSVHQGDLTKQKAAMDIDMVNAIMGKIYNSQFGFSFFNLPLRFPRLL